MKDTSSDQHDLARFADAQVGVYEVAISELRAGKKRSHWMWYIFPQVAGLGSSWMAQRYAIRSRTEAEAYLAHPILGRRIVACAEALLEVQDRTAEEIFGHPDYLKLQSSMTLFAAVSASGSIFESVLEQYYGGAKDVKTVAYLKTR